MGDLPYQEFLFTVAEVAAAFVGFSLIGGILKPADGTARFLMMRDVAQISLTAVAGSLLPYVLFRFGLHGETLWRFSSGGLVSAWVIEGAFAYRRGRRAVNFGTARSLLLVGLLGNLSGVGLLIWSASFGGALSGPRYLLALSILLVLAGCTFIWAAFQNAIDPPAV